MNKSTIQPNKAPKAEINKTLTAIWTDRTQTKSGKTNEMERESEGSDEGYASSQSPK